MRSQVYQQKQILKTIKLSKEKVEELGQKHYNNAMRHIQRLKNNQKLKQQKESKKNQEELSQCTFKPKTNDRNKIQKKNKIKTEIEEDSNKKEKGLPTYQRLLNWGKKRQIRHRGNIVINQALMQIQTKHSPIDFELNGSKVRRVRTNTITETNEFDLTINTIIPLSIEGSLQKKKLKTFDNLKRSL